MPGIPPAELWRRMGLGVGFGTAGDSHLVMPHESKIECLEKGQARLTGVGKRDRPGFAHNHCYFWYNVYDILTDMEG